MPAVVQPAAVQPAPASVKSYWYGAPPAVALAEGVKVSGVETAYDGATTLMPTAAVPTATTARRALFVNSICVGPPGTGRELTDGSPTPPSPHGQDPRILRCA